MPNDRSMVGVNGLSRIERTALTVSGSLVSFCLVVFVYAIITYVQHEQVIAKESSAIEKIVIQVDTQSTSVLKPPPEKVTEPVVVPASPVTLQIPSLDINAPIGQLGLKSDGAMEAPVKPEDTGWFKLGVPPGMNGNAVIAGHLTNRTGKPAVFYNLSKLVPGDEIKVVDEKGNTQRFLVTRSESYPYDQAPLAEIFGAYARPRLNLITCDGSWVRKQGTYNQRLVVYSELAL